MWGGGGGVVTSLKVANLFKNPFWPTGLVTCVLMVTVSRTAVLLSLLATIYFKAPGPSGSIKGASNLAGQSYSVFSKQSEFRSPMERGAFYLHDHCQGWQKLIWTNGKELHLWDTHKGRVLNHCPQRICDCCSPLSPTVKFKA